MFEKGFHRTMVDVRRAGGALAFGLILCAGTALADAEADWQARSTAPGVFYKNNFDFADRAALIDSGWNHTIYIPERAELETVNKLSGRGAFKALIPNTSDEGTVAYQHSFDMPVGSQTQNTHKRTFYYQFQVYIPRYVLDHRFATVNDFGLAERKFAIIQAPDRSFSTGEVVVTNYAFRWFVTAYYFSGTGVKTFDKMWVTKPSDCNGSPEYGWQNAIDAGPQSNGSQTDATSCALFKRRYGPMNYSFSGTTDYGAGTLSAQGNPDPDAALNGVTWVPDDWNVIEVYVDDEPGTNDTVKIWHARRGNPPKLLISSTGIDLGDDPRNYTGVQLVPRLEEMAPDPTRQDTYTIYDEVIASDNFIEFPGGSLRMR